MSLAEVTGAHSVNNYVYLGQHCRGSAVAARSTWVLSGASKSCGWEPGQALAEVRASDGHTFLYGYFSFVKNIYILRYELTACHRC